MSAIGQSSQHEFNLTFKSEGADRAMLDLRRLINSITLTQHSLTGMLMMLKRMNLPPELDSAVTVLYNMLAVLNAVRAAMIALQAASGPVGWAMLAVGAGVGIGSFVYGQMEIDARTGNY